MKLEFNANGACLAVGVQIGVEGGIRGKSSQLDGGRGNRRNKGENRGLGAQSLDFGIVAKLLNMQMALHAGCASC